MCGEKWDLSFNIRNISFLKKPWKKMSSRTENIGFSEEEILRRVKKLCS